MKVFTFKHGVHLSDEKEMTCDKPIEVIVPKTGAVLIMPMLQHIGAACDPIVEIGERVLAGQKIGDSKSYMSVPVHASVSGIVREIKPVLTPAGITCTGIYIENDGKFEEISGIEPNEDYKSFQPEKIIELVREAGVVGLGGAGFPTHVKLNLQPGKKVDTVLMNASECEPYLTVDYRLLLEESERIMRGFLIILSLFPGAKGIIGIEANKMPAITKFMELVKPYPEIEVCPLKPKYPQGAEKNLIYACTRRVVPSGGLPVDVGCLVHNVDTVIAVERAVVRGRPLMRKVVTVTGDAVNNPGNFKIRLGMTYMDLVETTGGFKEKVSMIFTGGPMMGVSMFDVSIPVTKTSSALVCLTEGAAQTPEELNCIRCGKCIEHCPVHLMPLNLNQYALRGEAELFEKYRGFDCIECGSCSFVCPAKRHLAQSIRSTRRNLMSFRKK